jgi:hypothetical protein
MKAVGYLCSGHSYPRGKVSRLFFERLVALVEDPLGYSRGYHNCNLGSCSLKESVGSQHGTKLGPYEILSPLGASGMGEMYTA